MGVGKKIKMKLYNKTSGDGSLRDQFSDSTISEGEDKNPSEIKLKEISRINSHHIRHSNAKILNVLDLLEKGQIESEDAIQIIARMSENIEQDTIAINSLLIDQKRSSTGNNVVVLDKPVSHIWLVDDDITVNYVHKRIMEKDLGLKVTTFSDPVKALDQLKRNQDIPDLIFLDINMPGVDGFAFMKQILGSHPSMKVIILSSSVAAEDVSTALSFNQVISYYTKPLRPEMVDQLRSANSIDTAL